MNEVQLYSLGEEGEQENRGQVSLQTAQSAVEKYAHAHVGIEGSTAYIAAHSIFGFSIKDKAFLEIHVESETHFLVKLRMSEEIKFFFLKVPGLFEKSMNVTGISALKEMVVKFFELAPAAYKTYFLAASST